MICYVIVQNHRSILHLQFGRGMKFGLKGLYLGQFVDCRFLGIDCVLLHALKEIKTARLTAGIANL